MEKNIRTKNLKFPFDYIMALRVETFHRLLANQFLSALKEKFDPEVEDFEMDMRNWNGSFKMGELKKMLDKEFAQEGAMRLIGR